MRHDRLDTASGAALSADRALLGLPLGGALVSRLGSRWSLRAGFALYLVILAPLAVVPSRLRGRAARGVGGVQQRRRCGAECGGCGVGGAAASADAVPTACRPERRPTRRRADRHRRRGRTTALAAHFTAIAIVSALAALSASGCLPQGAPVRRTPIVVRPERQLMLLGFVAFCVFLIDGGASYWVAVDLRTEHHASSALAAAAYTLFTAAMAFGACSGTGTDPIRPCPARAMLRRNCRRRCGCGRHRVDYRDGADRWAIIGTGVAALTPTVLGAAPGRATKSTPAAAIAAATTLGCLSSFTGPPVIGGLASLTGLSAALGLLAVAGGAATLLAPTALRDGRSRRARSPRLKR